MKISPDLHAHSTASDGVLAPTKLFERAHGYGVRVMALTDHDTLEGLSEARGAALELGMDFVPGVEISVTWNGGTVHILGLGVDETAGELEEGLAGLRRFRDWRAEEIGRRLERSGYPGMYERARALSNGRLISRTHFARALVEAGHADTVSGVFRRFLVRSRPGHVAGEWASLADAARWIRAAGGQAVIAHPARYKMTRTRLRKLISEFVDAGGVGLEVISGSHSRDEMFTMAAHARDFGLLGSAGSDFHDPTNPWVELGQLPRMPDGVRPIWQDWELPRLHPEVGP